MRIRGNLARYGTSDRLTHSSPDMSIKSLAALVFVLVAGVLASARCYLAVVPRLPVQFQATPSERCGTAPGAPCNLPESCVGAPGVQALRDGHRWIYRSSLAIHRRETTAQMPGDS